MPDGENLKNLHWLFALSLAMMCGSVQADRLPVREWSGRWEIVDLPVQPRFGDAFGQLVLRRRQGASADADGGPDRQTAVSVLAGIWNPSLSFHSSVRGGIPGLYAARPACTDHRGAVRIQAEAIRFTPDAGAAMGGLNCDAALAGIDEDFGARLNAVRRWRLASNGADWSQMIWRLELLDVHGKPLIVLQRR